MATPSTQNTNAPPPNPEDDGLLLTHCSKDQKIKLCRYLPGSNILNSALERDHPAKFTYLSDFRMSVIDYIIASRNLLHHAKALEVMPKFNSYISQSCFG